MDKIGGGTLKIPAFLFILYISDFLSDLLLTFFGVNLDTTFCWNILLWLLVFKEFHIALYMDKIKDQTAWLNLERARISFFVFPTSLPFQVKSAIWRSEVEIFLKLMSKNSVVPKRDKYNASLSYEFGSVSCLSLYGIKDNSRP